MEQHRGIFEEKIYDVVELFEDLVNYLPILQGGGIINKVPNSYMLNCSIVSL